MSVRSPFKIDYSDDVPGTDEATERPDDPDLWFLPGPMEEDFDHLPPGPRVECIETSILADWAQAEAGLAARLARVAGRLGALDGRLQRGPEGWRHRLALIEAAELSWFVGDRVSPDRLALWIGMRLSGAQEDMAALTRIGWAVRRLTGGPGPEAGLADFLDRRDIEAITERADRFADRADGWLDLMTASRHLHPITRACVSLNLWSLAGLGQNDGRMEAIVTAARIAASDGKGAIFAPLTIGGQGGMLASGPPAERLARFLEGMDRAILTAMRHLDDIESWSKRAEAAMKPLSGRTAPSLRAALTEWPTISAPMAETLTGASRAAVQRNLVWMEANGLVRELSGQSRFRIWTSALARW